jgi:hypothetical protein
LEIRISERGHGDEQLSGERWGVVHSIMLAEEACGREV